MTDRVHAWGGWVLLWKGLFCNWKINHQEEREKIRRGDRADEDEGGSTGGETLAG